MALQWCSNGVNPRESALKWRSRASVSYSSRAARSSSRTSLTQQQPSFGSSSNPANHSQMQVLQSQPSRYYTNHAETSLNNQYSGHNMSKREQDSQYSGQQDRRAKKQSLHCKSCHAKFDNPALLQEHLQSDLHLMVNGDWWKTHRPPPKTITSQDHAQKVLETGLREQK